MQEHWPHAPVHKLGPGGVFIVTAATLHKEHLFREPERLDFLHSRLLALAERYHWQLEAWAVFSNHYHFVARSGPGARDLRRLLSHLHTETALEMNRLDETPGRRVWFNFWDTRLTYRGSYLARLNYVHQNAVKHGIVKMANQYRWCSAAWFERVASTAMVETIYAVKTDRVVIEDNF